MMQHGTCYGVKMALKVIKYKLRKGTALKGKHQFIFKVNDMKLIGNKSLVHNTDAKNYGWLVYIYHENKLVGKKQLSGMQVIELLNDYIGTARTDVLWGAV